MYRRALLATASLASLARAAGAQPARPAPGRPITVFAAASLTDALRAQEAPWRARGGAPLVLSFAASSALARQIEAGAPADLFMSADEPWADYLQQRDLIVPETRTSPLANALVLVAPADRATPVDLRFGTDLLPLLGPDGRLATGDPASVPVGNYARQALTAIGAWDAIGPRIAPAADVRSALLLVARGEAPLGIVYATDVLAAPGVRVIGTFAPSTHSPITYPFALTRRAADHAEARDLLRYLTGPDAAAVWRRYGFVAGGEPAQGG